MFTGGFVGTIGVVYVPNYAIYCSCGNCSDCVAKQLSVSFFFFIFAKARMIPHASPSEAAVSFNKK